jgi:hypothetical protein
MTDEDSNAAHARLQAWVINLITIVANAFEHGTVLGRCQLAGGAYADVAYVPAEHAAVLKPHGAVRGVALAVEIFRSGVRAASRQSRQDAFAAERVLEYWQIDAETGRAHLYQANSNWQYDEIAPDKGGLHFSCVIEELAFPVIWFKDQPDLWSMMEWWELIAKN